MGHRARSCSTRRWVTRGLTVGVLVLGVGVGVAGAQQAIYVVRHAERADQSSDSALSEAGRARARTLARLLAKADVTAVYATEYRRTFQTAQPLAEDVEVDIQRIPAEETDSLVSTLRRRHADDVVLVVGHSNTVPAVLAAYGHPGHLEIAHDEYDNLFVLIPRADGPPTVLRLSF